MSNLIFHNAEIEIKTAIEKVIGSGQFLLDKETKGLEKEIANYLNVKYAVAVSSGTSALVLSLKVLITKETEVITTPFSFISSSSAIAQVGAGPVFVDIGKDKNINVDLIEKAITRKTKAILPVHLFGKQCGMDKIMEIADKHELFVVEDMAQAFGLSLRGDVGCLSFYPTKVLGAMGDAGMVITNDSRIAEEVRALRNHGIMNKKYKHEILGENARMDEIQAAVLRVKLKYIEKLKKGFSYDETKYYPYPIHLQPCFKYLRYVKGDFPNAEREAEKVRANYM